MKCSNIFLALLLLLPSCAVEKAKVQTELRQVDAQTLVSSLLGGNESINAYLEFLPKGTRMVKMVQQNMEYSNRLDTLVSLNYKKSKILFLKNNFNREFLLGGTVCNNEIALSNGIRTGIKRTDLIGSIIGLEQTQLDTISVFHGNREIKFIFNKKGMLTKYTFHGSTR